MNFRDRKELYVRKNPWEGTIVGVFDGALNGIQGICQRCTKISDGSNKVVRYPLVFMDLQINPGGVLIPNEGNWSCLDVDALKDNLVVHCTKVGDYLFSWP